MNTTLLKALGFVVIIVIGSFMFFGSKDIAPMYAAKNNFKMLLKTYDQERVETVNAIKEEQEHLLNFKSAIKDARDKDSQFLDLHDRWTKCKSKVDHFKSNFIDLVKGADLFYDEMTLKAKSIQNEEQVNISLEIIEEGKSKYIERLKVSKSAVDGLIQLAIYTKDQITALEIKYAVASIDEKLDEVLSELDSELPKMIKELEKLSQESWSLISDESHDQS